MSLLMDALKKAELAKRKAQPESASPAPAASPSEAIAPTEKPALDFSAATSSAPATTRTTGGSTGALPKLPEHLELLDAEFDTKASVGGSRNGPESALLQQGAAAGNFSLQDTQSIAEPSLIGDEPEMAAEGEQRAAVQNLFETKQTAPSRKLFGIAVSVATIFALAAIGLYFWTELQPKSGLQAGTSTGLFPRVARLPPPAPAEGGTTQVISGLPLPNDAAPIAAAPNAPVAEPAKPFTPPIAAPQNKKLFNVTAAAPLSNQTLDRAYDAMARGDKSAAKAAYEKVLGNDAKNLDALAGLAVLAQTSGNSDMAANYYLQMLDADPSSAIAMAGLINLQSHLDPGLAETRLKQALGAQPDSPALNFSLGNVYARTMRWSDAQQAYFKAMTGDPGNPDFLFNLAVSLDHLNQTKLAAKFYAQAIAAAEVRPTGFDKAQANERLQKLPQ